MTDVGDGDGGGDSPATPSARSRPAASRSVRRGRPHPAEGGRVVATGVGVAAMLGSVAVMGLLDRRHAEAVEVGPVVPAGAVAAGSSPATAGSVVTGAGSAGAGDATSTAPAIPATTVAPPIALTARPVVRVATEPAASQAPAAVAPAPTAAAPQARTNGSR